MEIAEYCERQEGELQRHGGDDYLLGGTGDGGENSSGGTCCEEEGSGSKLHKLLNIMMRIATKIYIFII